MYEKYKDYINPEELAEFFASHDKMDEECWDKIEEYIELLYKNGDLPNGISGFDNHAEKGYEWVRNPYKIEDFGEDYIVKNLIFQVFFEIKVKFYPYMDFFLCLEYDKYKMLLNQYLIFQHFLIL